MHRWRLWSCSSMKLDKPPKCCPPTNSANRRSWMKEYNPLFRQQKACKFPHMMVNLWAHSALVSLPRRLKEYLVSRAFWMIVCRIEDSWLVYIIQFLWSLQMMFLPKRCSEDHSLVHVNIFITVVILLYTLTPFIELISRSLSLFHLFTIPRGVSIQGTKSTITPSTTHTHRCHWRY